MTRTIGVYSHVVCESCLFDPHSGSQLAPRSSSLRRLHGCSDRAAYRASGFAGRGRCRLSVELGSWQYMHRSAQNAADSAALAAATVNSGGGSSTAQNEARAAAQKFGSSMGKMARP